MTIILCPTRGGKESKENQLFAIRQAKETSASLIFLYVSNIQFTSMRGSPMIVDLSREMDEMGQFFLAIAQERAAKSGVQAETVVAHGDFKKIVHELIQQRPINTVCMGATINEMGIVDETINLQLAQFLNQHHVTLLISKQGELMQTHSIIHKKNDRFLGALLGLATGDAVGTTLEFKPRGSFTPIKDMVGGGPFHLKPGEWTDDTSMALCLATSLIAQGKFDARDQMERYCRWMNDGYLSSNGRCFDIGVTVSNSLRNFEKTGEPFSGSTHPYSAGNGSIMRLAPIPMFYFPDKDTAIHYAAQSSRTTHATEESVDACRLFASILIDAFLGKDKSTILFSQTIPDLSPKIAEIATGAYQKKKSSDISGAGYVVPSLEAALWSFWKTDNFADAILTAANLGDDADTTAAITGQIAGAYYGAVAIPQKWLEKLSMRHEIEHLADQLAVGSTE